MLNVVHPLLVLLKIVPSLKETLVQYFKMYLCCSSRSNTLVFFSRNEFFIGVSIDNGISCDDETATSVRNSSIGIRLQLLKFLIKSTTY